MCHGKCQIFYIYHFKRYSQEPKEANIMYFHFRRGRNLYLQKVLKFLGSRVNELGVISSDSKSYYFCTPSQIKYWNGQPFPFPRNFPGPGMEPRSPALQEDSLPPESPGKPQVFSTRLIISWGEEWRTRQPAALSSRRLLAMHHYSQGIAFPQKR